MLMIKNFTFLCILLCSCKMVAQIETIRGQIVAVSKQTEGVLVKNKQLKTTTISIKGGFFSIQAQENDSLVFSAVHLKKMVYRISKNDFKNTLLLIPMDTTSVVLKEILVINPQNFSSGFELSDLNKKQLSNITENLVNPIATSNTGMLNLTSTLGKLIQLIKGKPKPNIIKISEDNLELLNRFFSTDFYNQELKIPSEYINGFKYYCLEKPEIKEALNQKQKNVLELLLYQCADEFLKSNKL